MTRWLALATMLSGCNPCQGAFDGCVSTSVETLSCDVQWSDGGIATGISAQCTGADDAGAVTDFVGRFQLEVSVQRGGFAGWFDRCGVIEFRDGQTLLTTPDAGLRAWSLNGAYEPTGCLVVVE